MTSSELGPRLPSDRYTIENLQARLDTLKKDPWSRFFPLRQGISRGLLEELGA